MPVVADAWRSVRQGVVSPVLRVHADRLLVGPIRARSDRLSCLADMSRWWRRARLSVELLDSREDLYTRVLQMATPSTYLEFGVASGRSIRWWLEHVTSEATRFSGFDTFDGLPEPWGSQPAGTYTAGGVAPIVDDERATFIIGRFEDTVGPFFEGCSLVSPVIVHLDADLYSSTTIALDSVLPRLRSGDILIFDELLDVGTPDHEYRAFRDAITRHALDAQVVAAVRRGPQVAMRIRRR